MNLPPIIWDHWIIIGRYERWARVGSAGFVQEASGHKEWCVLVWGREPTGISLANASNAKITTTGLWLWCWMRIGGRKRVAGLAFSRCYKTKRLRLLNSSLSHTTKYTVVNLLYWYPLCLSSCFLLQSLGVGYHSCANLFH